MNHLVVFVRGAEGALNLRSKVCSPQQRLSKGREHRNRTHPYTTHTTVYCAQFRFSM